MLLSNSASTLDEQPTPSQRKVADASAGPSTYMLTAPKSGVAISGPLAAAHHFSEPKYTSFEDSAFTTDGKPRQILHKRIAKCHRAAADRASQAKTASVFDKPRATKKEAACPYTEEWVVYEDETETVYVYERMGHMGHTPGDADDMKYLPLDSDLVEVVEKLLCAGLTPQQLVDHLHKEVFSGVEIFKKLDEVLFQHPTLNVTARDIENIRKRMYIKTRIHKNDVKAVKQLVELLGSSVVLYHHPQVYDEEEEEVKEHLRLAISTPIQRAMLKEFGSKLIFMDAVFGLSKYGFPTLALVVRDEFGHGFPVGYCIASNEDGAIWAEFLTAILQSACLDPANVTFMIDKSSIEIAAIGEIKANYLLCRFHMMQEWERFLRSSDSGVHGKANDQLRGQVLAFLSELQQTKDAATFEAKSLKFEAFLEEKTKKETINPVLHKYLNWKKDASHWAKFGRLHVDDLRSDTNNLVEAHFRRVKHVSSQGKIATRLDQQVFLLLDEVTHFITTRAQRLRGGLGIAAERNDLILQRHITLLSSPEKEYIQFMADNPGENGDVGLAVCRSTAGNGKTYHLSLADGSCCCPANSRWPCKHVEAASTHPERCPTLNMVTAAAGIIRNSRQSNTSMVEVVSEKNGIFAVTPLCMQSNGDLAKQQKRLYDVNTIEKCCSCNMYSSHSVCPHLLALLDEEDRGVLIAEALITDTDHSKVMLKVVCKRRLMPSPVSEPTINVGSELELLHSTRNKVNNTSKSNRENDFIAGTARNITDLAKDMDPGARHLLHIKLLALEEEARSRSVTFKKTAKRQQKSDTKKNKRAENCNRSTTDKKHKPLFKTRTRSTATKVVENGRNTRRSALKAAEEQFAVEQEPQQALEKEFVAAKRRGGGKKVMRVGVINGGSFKRSNSKRNKRR